jgi:aspartyl/asparaginyl beta-hydroxylase (cupin superfamily)
MYIDPDLFAFTGLLEREWRTIRAEFESVGREALMAWPERFLYDQGWDVLGLHAFGSKLLDNCARCPATTRLVESIPGMTTAGFSVLQPGTHIRPHVGYTGSVLRCHLGLVVPAGCEMRVGSETRGWQEGKCLVFDDTVEHEVWHRGSEPRAILLVDFLKSAHREALMERPERRPAST